MDEKSYDLTKDMPRQRRERQFESPCAPVDKYDDPPKPVQFTSRDLLWCIGLVTIGLCFWSEQERLANVDTMLFSMAYVAALPYLVVGCFAVAVAALFQKKAVVAMFYVVAALLIDIVRSLF